MNFRNLRIGFCKYFIPCWNIFIFLFHRNTSFKKNAFTYGENDLSMKNKTCDSFFLKKIASVVLFPYHSGNISFSNV
jgi:hypothetical protein